MKRFLLRLAVFAVPILLYVSVPAFVLFRSGENFCNPEKTVVSTKKYLIGYAYNENNYQWLKWKTITEMPRKQVMALGSSRVLQFRKEMFTDDFYNAGYTVSGLRDFAAFLESVPKEKYPKYLIIALDQWMFNPNWDNFSGKIDKNRWANSLNKNPNLAILNAVWKDLANRKYGLNLEKPNDAEYVGLNAVVNHKGFRNDGSMDYGRQIDELLKDTLGHYADTYKRITSGTQRFEHADHINLKAIAEVEKLLVFCKKHKINVIAFVAPFGDSVYDKMIVSGHYAYLKDIIPAIKPLFNTCGFELYDFSRVADVGSNDGETLDGFHASEVTSLKMLLKMLKTGSALNSVADVNRLEIDLKNQVNRYQVYR